jgi:stearoyl-CoA desaturase (delta-9 desaturase)
MTTQTSPGEAVAVNDSPRINYVNTLFLATAHLLAAFTVVYFCVFHFSWWTLGIGLVWGVLCGLAITGGYHRLFAHPTYKAAWPVRLFYLMFGAAIATTTRRPTSPTTRTTRNAGSGGRTSGGCSSRTTRIPTSTA